MNSAEKNGTERREARGEGTERHGDAVRATLGTILVAFLGVITAWATASGGTALRRLPLTWVIIAWTLVGTAIVGLWPLLRRIPLLRRRPRLTITALLATVVTSLVLTAVLQTLPRSSPAPLIDTRHWRPDGTDAIDAGCRRRNGQSQVAASKYIDVGGKGGGTFQISYNTYATCGLIWAEFTINKDAHGKRPFYRDLQIVGVYLELRRDSPAATLPDRWYHAIAGEEHKDDNDRWTDALNLKQGGAFHAVAVITLADGRKLRAELSTRRDPVTHRRLAGARRAIAVAGSGWPSTCGDGA